MAPNRAGDGAEKGSKSEQSRDLCQIDSEGLPSAVDSHTEKKGLTEKEEKVTGPAVSGSYDSKFQPTYNLLDPSHTTADEHISFSKKGLDVRTSIIDRKAILEALKGKKLAQLQEFERTNKRIKINLKSVEQPINNNGDIELKRSPQNCSLPSDKVSPSIATSVSKDEQIESKNQTIEVDRPVTNSTEIVTQSEDGISKVIKSSDAGVKDSRSSIATDMKNQLTGTQANTEKCTGTRTDVDSEESETSKFLSRMKSKDKDLKSDKKSKRYRSKRITDDGFSELYLDNISSSENEKLNEYHPRLEDVSSIDEMEEGEILDSEDLGNKDGRSSGVETKKGPSLLLAGDSNIKHIVPSRWSFFRQQTWCTMDTYDMHSFCSVISDRLNTSQQFDVVIIFISHLNLVYTEKVLSEKELVNVMNVRKSVDVTHMLKVVDVHHNKWTKLYPNVKFIWATPYPIDILAYNESQTVRKFIAAENKFMEETLLKQANVSYWNYVREIYSCCSRILVGVPVFPMHHVMFSKKHNRSAFGNGTGVFPKGYLVNGLQPSTKFVNNFSYLFEQYMIEKFPPTGDKQKVEKSMSAISEAVISWEKTFGCPSKAFAKRGDSSNLPRYLFDALVAHRKEYELYNQTPSLHPKHSEQQQQYSWHIVSKKNSPSDLDWQKYWLQFLKLSFDQSWESKKFLLMQKRGDKGTRFDSRMKTSKKRRNGHNSDITISSDSDGGRLSRNSNGSRSKSRNSESSKRHKSRSHPSVHKKSRRHRSHTRKNKRKHRKRCTSSESSSSSEEEVSKKRGHDQEDDEIDDIELLIRIERAKRAERESKREAAKKQNNGIESKEASLVKHSQVQNGASIPVIDLEKCQENNSTNVNDHSNGNTEMTIPKSNSHVNHAEVKLDEIAKSVNEKNSENSFSNQNFDNTDIFEPVVMDVDLDERIENIIDDPDFLDDLQNIGDELGILMEAESSTLATEAENLEENKENVEQERRTEPFDRRGNYLVEVLRILNNVSNHFGSLSTSIVDLYKRSVECLENGRDPLKLLSKSQCAILEVIYSKLKRYIEDPSTADVHRALYSIASKELRQILDNPQPNTDMFFGINIANIAKATLGNPVDRVLDFIKHTFMYHGMADVPKEDIVKMYMAVKAMHLKLMDNDGKLSVK